MSKPIIQPESIRSLLIRSTNWVGDAIMTTPAVRVIRDCFPGARLSVLAKPLVAPVFENSPRVDEVLIYEDTGRHRGFSGKIRLARDMRRHRFEAALLLQNAFEAAFITAAARVPVRVGYDTDGRGLLLTHPVRNYRRYKQGHHVDYFLSIVEQSQFGNHCPNGRRQLEFFTGQSDRAEAGRILSENDLAGDRLLGLSPGATFGPAKQWPPERYSQLADELCQEAGWQAVILGGPGDRATAGAIAGAMKSPVINLCGRTSLGQAAALMERCGLFVSNDSGLMHLAAALAVPLVAVFGSTSAEATGPLSANSRVVQVDLDCRPCLKPECPRGHTACLEKISVNMVKDAVREVLAT
ncbi:MAG: lipopolysaccharide heptosyltransferase II [Desulfosudaceae bacterium]